ncbi:MAG: hypothetical protein CSB15_00875 [Clostridiales bacterium]|nr:MAG: hypothetical protein CSB15_00875 [Clostridiales bacterium]
MKDKLVESILKIAPNMESDYSVRMYYILNFQAVFVHLCHVFLFNHIGLASLFLYNLLSIVFYIFCFVLLKFNKLKTFFLLCHIEICLYAVITVLLVGFGFNIPYALFILISTLIFSPFKKALNKNILGIIEVILFSILSIGFYLKPLVIEEKYTFILKIFSIANIISIILAIYTIVIVTGRYNKRFKSDVSKHIDEIKNQVRYDAVTNLLNEVAVGEEIRNIDSVYRKSSISYVITVFDIDMFKEVNAKYGRELGDYILKTIADIVLKNTNMGDIIGRWGGDRFIIIYKNTTINKAIVKVEKLRELIEKSLFEKDGEIFNVTATFGILESKRNMDIENSLDIVRKLMIAGKYKGRNQINY